MKEKTEINYYTWSSLQSIVYMITFNPWSFSPFYTYKLFRPFLIFPETVLFCSSIIRRNIRKVLNSPTEYMVKGAKINGGKYFSFYIKLTFWAKLGAKYGSHSSSLKFSTNQTEKFLMVNSINISYASSVKSVLADGTLCISHEL